MAGQTKEDILITARELFNEYGYKNISMRDIAKKLNISLIDHYGYWMKLLSKGEKEFRNYVPDGIHPNLTAQKELVLPCILKVLKTSNAKR